MEPGLTGLYIGWFCVTGLKEPLAILGVVGPQLSTLYHYPNCIFLSNGD